MKMNVAFVRYLPLDLLPLHSLHLLLHDGSIISQGLDLQLVLLADRACLLDFLVGGKHKRVDMVSCKPFWTLSLSRGFLHDRG